jgi:hypothetical protein
VLCDRGKATYQPILFIIGVRTLTRPENPDPYQMTLVASYHPLNPGHQPGCNWELTQHSIIVISTSSACNRATTVRSPMQLQTLVSTLWAEVRHHTSLWIGIIEGLFFFRSRRHFSPAIGMSILLWLPKRRNDANNWHITRRRYRRGYTI